MRYFDQSLVFAIFSVEKVQVSRHRDETIRISRVDQEAEEVFGERGVSLGVARWRAAKRKDEILSIINVCVVDLASATSHSYLLPAAVEQADHVDATTFGHDAKLALKRIHVPTLSCVEYN